MVRQTTMRSTYAAKPAHSAWPRMSDSDGPGGAAARQTRRCRYRRLLDEDGSSLERCASSASILARAVGSGLSGLGRPLARCILLHGLILAALPSRNLWHDMAVARDAHTAPRLRPLGRVSVQSGQVCAAVAGGTAATYLPAGGAAGRTLEESSAAYGMPAAQGQAQQHHDLIGTGSNLNDICRSHLYRRSR